MSTKTKTTITKKYDFQGDVQNLYTKTEKKLKALNGKTYTFKFDNKFKQMKKQDLLNNMLEIKRVCEIKGEKIDMELVLFNLVVKYFTNVYRDEEGKDLYTNASMDIYKKTMAELKIMEELIELKLFDQIIDNIDAEEVATLKGFIKNFGKNYKIIVDEAKKLEEENNEEEVEGDVEE